MNDPHQPVSLEPHNNIIERPSMDEKQILAIAEALRVAYLRGSRDPKKTGMTDTIHELRDFLIEELSQPTKSER